MTKSRINYLGLAIILSLVITLAIWLSMKTLDLRFGTWSLFSHSLGQLTGLFGVVLFAWVLVLTTRLELVEDLVGGLDRVYRMHHLLGVLSFVFLLFHPILLVVKFIPSNLALAAKYLSWSGSWAVNYGIAALVMMILLIVLTFFINLKYGTWKNSHRLMGLVFIVASLHIFLVKTDITNSLVLKIWMIFICLVGLVAHIYGSYLRVLIKKDYEYVIESILTQDRVSTLVLSPVSKVMKFKAGQFAFIKPKLRGLEEKHPFTIASSPSDSNKLKFSIKHLGDFTSKLGELKKGMNVSIEGPYGRFNALEDSASQVWVAGGIGITPFLSFLEEMVEKKIEKRVDLFYCVKNKSEAVFLEHLNELNKKLKDVRIIVYFSDTEGYLTTTKIKKKIDIFGKRIYLCCPPQMLNSLKDQLIKEGISKRDILAEEFNIL